MESLAVERLTCEGGNDRRKASIQDEQMVSITS